jgi:hypothetical protein
MSTVQFQIFYSGPDLESGKMDVRELAPALLAVGGLLEESNRVLNGERSSVSVKVNRFEDGSFGINFEVIQNIKDQVIALFSGQEVTAASNMIQVLGFGGSSVFGLYKLIKWAKGRKPNVNVIKEKNVELNFGEETITIQKEVFDLYRDIKVRKEAENTVRPLEKEGVDRFEARYNNELIESVDKKEVAYFKVPEIEDEKIDEQETDRSFTIHSLSFKEDNKWRLSDGTNVFFVTISDQEFLRKVNENLISFSKGDILRVRLRTKTWQVIDGIRTEYEAIEILEHRSAARQLTFNFSKET